jgi:hypothetical protein
MIVSIALKIHIYQLYVYAIRADDQGLATTKVGDCNLESRERVCNIM